MGEAFTYIYLLTAFIILPTICVIITNFRTIHRYKLVIVSSLIILPVTFVWDYLSTVNKVWYFVNILNIWILGLPIEELIFMSFFIVFISSVTLIILKKKR